MSDILPPHRMAYPTGLSWKTDPAKEERPPVYRSFIAPSTSRAPHPVTITAFHDFEFGRITVSIDDGKPAVIIGLLADLIVREARRAGLTSIDQIVGMRLAPEKDHRGWWRMRPVRSSVHKGETDNAQD